MVTAYAPTEPPATRGRRMRAPVLTIGGLALTTVALHFRDPHSSGTWGYCPSALLGFSCPGCGGLRAVNDLTNGQVGAALSSNLLVTVLIPFAVVLLGVWALDRWEGRERKVPWDRVRPWAYAFFVVVLTFTVLRNTGPGAWLAP